LRGRWVHTKSSADLPCSACMSNPMGRVRVCRVGRALRLRLAAWTTGRGLVSATGSGLTKTGSGTLCAGSAGRCSRAAFLARHRAFLKASSCTGLPSASASSAARWWRYQPKCKRCSMLGKYSRTSPARLRAWPGTELGAPASAVDNGSARAPCLLPLGIKKLSSKWCAMGVTFSALIGDTHGTDASCTQDAHGSHGNAGCA